MAEPTKFTRKVWRACARVPSGRVTTYGEIAKNTGSARASRAVGNALNASPGMKPPKGEPRVPCHRAVKAGGKLGGFAKGTKAKRALLEKEGLTVRRGKIVGFEKKFFRFTPSIRLK